MKNPPSAVAVCLCMLVGRVTLALRDLRVRSDSDRLGQTAEWRPEPHGRSWVPVPELVSRSRT